MRFALAQINPVVGDLKFNSDRILDYICRARSAGAQVVVFPELALVGYPPKDLLLRSAFIDDNLAALKSVATACTDITALVGYADRNPASVGRPLFNAVATLSGGRVASRHYKTLLPTYDVFDESRYFEPAPAHAAGASSLLTLRDGDTSIRAGVSICEDLWNDEHFIARRLYHQTPIRDLQQAGADLLINASASPYTLGKHEFRLKMFAAQAREFGKPLIYVNQVGGNDELVFDGNSLVLGADGQVLAHAKDFEEDLLLFDLSARPHPAPIVPRTGLASLHAALVMGLRDYARKCGFKSVVLGLSGGIDSALTAALATDALGPGSVTGIALPSRYSSDHSVEDARKLAENLGIRFQIAPIEQPHAAYERLLGPLLGEPPASPDSQLLQDLTEQNLQARIRGATLMAFSNRFNHLLLTTGNKSEIATGYCTLYGDMCGGLCLLSDVPKTAVWELSRFHNTLHGRELIPLRSITKVPSAELRPNQTDQDSLPPYDLLDAILERYIEQEKGPAEIIADGFDAATVNRVVRLVDRSEYKRRQAAPGLKVTSRAFGFGRRMPIAMNYVPTIK